MPNYFCHEHPDILTLETEVVDRRPDAVVLRQSPFHPGGGGQLPDRGILRWGDADLAVTGFEWQDGRLWHRLADEQPATDLLVACVDPAFRCMMSELHTATHILNALVYRAFDGALVTSAQMNDDDTARMDFDLPEADNDRLRALEAEINALIARDLPVTYEYISLSDAQAVHGLIRSKSVAPPPDEAGAVRIVQIGDLDRQACGGCHLASTGLSRPIRILKVENKGRHNRRVKIGMVAR